jgi:hypothetical protein
VPSSARRNEGIIQVIDISMFPVNAFLLPITAANIRKVLDYCSLSERKVQKLVGPTIKVM